MAQNLLEESYHDLTHHGHINGLFFLCCMSLIALPFVVSVFYLAPSIGLLSNLFEPTADGIKRGIPLKDLSSVLEVSIGVNLALTIIHGFSEYIKGQAKSVIAFYRDPSFLDAFDAATREHSGKKSDTGIDIAFDPTQFSGYLAQQMQKEESQFDKACNGLTNIIKMMGIVIASESFVVLVIAGIASIVIPLWLAIFTCLAVFGAIIAHIGFCMRLRSVFVRGLESPPVSNNADGIYTMLVKTATKICRETKRGANKVLDAAVATRESD